MSHSRRGQTRPSTPMIGVIVFALLACIVYAWRFSRSNQTSEAPPPQPLVQMPVPSPPPTAPSPTPSPSTEETSTAAAPAGPANSSGTWANRPMSLPKKDEPQHAADALPGTESMRSALEAQRTGDVTTARKTLTHALDQGLSTEDADAARTELSRLADAMLFSSAISMSDPLIGAHEVAGGESIHSIASANHISESLLASINQIDRPSMVRAGQRLKVIHGPFWVRVDKSDHRMDVFLGDVIVRSYLVGLGAEGGTPLGTWVVRDKLKDPDWTDPNTNKHYDSTDPANPIGERWIALEGIEGEAVGKAGFGIHGTIEPQSIGKDMSMGCIRMLADDVAFLFDLLVIRDSKVIVKP